ncbi:hypothetical protein MBLNU459_g2113t1 [Dothideomycetes sp. NU459]
MDRNKRFHPDREPLRNDDSLELQQSQINGPFNFLNPTEAHYNPTPAQAAVKPQSNQTNGPPTSTRKVSDKEGKEEAEEAHVQAPAVQFHWTSRNNRKGRHLLSVGPDQSDRNALPKASTHWRHILHVLWLMLTQYPVWDISWCVAWIFTLGSVLWVLNAMFVFLPDVAPSSAFKDEVLTAGGVTAFIGATIFEIGSVLLMLEAINANREGCFGWAVEQAYEEHRERERSKTRAWRIRPDGASCTHHHTNRSNLVGKPRVSDSTAGPSSSDPEKQAVDSGKSWSWYPSMYDLRTHYAHDLGFIACSFQMAGASIFWISGFTALPGIINKLSPPALDGAYWFPQVLGGSGFIVSGLLFMLETQKAWWKPALGVLGWHIGFWNLIGGIGFTMSPAFGFDTSSWAQYQAGCSTFWGSWAFLIGSLIQLYESLDKNPVEVKKS